MELAQEEKGFHVAVLIIGNCGSHQLRYACESSWTCVRVIGWESAAKCLAAVPVAYMGASFFGGTVFNFNFFEV